MSAHLEATLWAAQSSQATGTAHSVLGADQPYAPQEPADDNGILEFFTSAQTILFIAVGLIAVVLLISQMWSNRREDREEGEKKREET